MRAKRERCSPEDSRYTTSPLREKLCDRRTHGVVVAPGLPILGALRIDPAGLDVPHGSLAIDEDRRGRELRFRYAVEPEPSQGAPVVIDGDRKAEPERLHIVAHFLDGRGPRPRLG